MESSAAILRGHEPCCSAELFNRKLHHHHTETNCIVDKTRIGSVAQSTIGLSILPYSEEPWRCDLEQPRGGPVQLFRIMEAATAAVSVELQTQDFAAVCLHHLLAVDIAVVQPTEAVPERLQTLAVTHAKKLLTKLYELPHEPSDEGRLALLPMRQAFPLPRQRKIPTAAPKTRWEKFAQEKDIQKRKRSRLVWDETSKDWVPRWGMGSVKEKKRRTEDAIFELKEGEDLRAALENRRSDSKIAKKKQEFRELRNKVEAAGGRMPRPQASPAGVATLEIDRKKGKAAIEEIQRRAAVSTASFGLYDKPIGDVSRKKGKKSSGGRHQTNKKQSVKKPVKGMAK